MGTVYDDPNRECLGLDPAWVEGTGGESGEPEPKEGEGEPTEPSELDAMTKDELLAYAQSLGISPANASMNKDELRASIEAHEG
jgi:hypothetical protein